MVISSQEINLATQSPQEHSISKNIGNGPNTDRKNCNGYEKTRTQLISNVESVEEY